MDVVSQSLNQSLSQIITAITTIIGILAMMVWISWQMAIASLLVLPISMVLMVIVVKQSQKYFKAQQKTLGDLNGHIEEVFSGHHIIKAFNAEDQVLKEFRALNSTLYGSAWKAQFLSGIMMPMISFIGNIGYVAVSILGAWFTVVGVIQIGDIVAFIQYMRRFGNPLSQVAQAGNIFQSTLAAGERVFDFLDQADCGC